MATSPTSDHRIPDELLNRMMMRRGSGMLLRALRGEPEPVELVAVPRPRHRNPKPSRGRYIPVSARTPIAMPQAAREIIEAVAEAFMLTVEELTGRSRAKYLIHARSVVYRLIRDRAYEDGHPKSSLPQIAAYMNRDHATICHSLNQFDVYCKHYPEVARVYESLREAVG